MFPRSLDRASIQHRLNLRLGLALLGVYILFGLAASYSFRLLTERYIASRLEHDAETLLVALLPAARDSGFVLNHERVSPVYERVYSGHYYQIQTPGQLLRSRSLWDYPLSMPAPEGEQPVVTRRTGPDDQLLLLWSRRFVKADQPVQIAVAEDLTPIRADVRRFQLAYVLSGLIVLFGLLAFQRRILRRGFRPLTEARAELVRLQRGEIDALSEQGPRELQPLVRQINQLLEVLQQRLARSRNALGNLAHALKTPLARLNQQLEHLPPGVSPEQRAELRSQLEQIRRLMERELKRARLAGHAVSGRQLDFHAVLAGLKGVLSQVYAEKGVDIELQVPEDLVVRADNEDMMELFGNLLDNACKWAQARVRVAAERRDEVVRVRIEDDGPGVEPDRLARLTQRGVRIDEDSSDGHGLGLAIAEDIVRHYGGTLELGRSRELGGFQATAVVRDQRPTRAASASPARDAGA